MALDEAPLVKYTVTSMDPSPVTNNACAQARLHATGPARIHLSTRCKRWLA